MVTKNRLSRFSARNSTSDIGSTMQSRSLAIVAAAVRELFAPPQTTRAQALSRMERQAALTHLVSSLELLSRPSLRRPGGLNNWEVSRRDAIRFKNPMMRSLFDFVGRRWVSEGLLVANSAASLVLLAPTRGRWLRGGAAATLAGTAYLLSARNREGGDGSDHASFLVQGMAALARAGGGDSRITDAALWAVSLQSAMSYAVSGWAKVMGSSWRDGSAMEGILRTRSYGNERVWKLARRFPTSVRVLSAGTVFLECTFPLAYLGRGRLAKTYVGGAAVFHYAVAAVMGLNRFLTAFTSLHPAVLYTARARTDTVGPDVGRSDTLVRVAGAATAGALLVMAVEQRRTRRKIEAGYGDEKWLYTSDGNRLAYRRRGVEGPDLPVYVFESGLQGVPESWEWIVDELASEGTVVTYQRAGFGRSSLLPGTAQSVEDLVGHTVELVDAVGRDRPVILVGHSQGGYLALRAAERSAADIRSLVLIDPAHPAIVDETQTTVAGEAVSMSSALARSIDLGLGCLVSMDFLKSLPPHVRDAAQSHYRDSRIWLSADREWAATLSHFETKPELPQLAIPLLVLTAQLTQDRHSTAGELHRELAALGAPGSQHEVLAETSHLSILHHRRGARRVARAILRFVDSVRHSAIQVPA